MSSIAAIADAAELIETRTGLAVRAQFRGEFDSILLSLAGDDLYGFIERLHAARETDAVWQALIKALTISETYFMRDQAHFTLLRAQILPELIARRRREDDLRMTIWSAGCASGEEPFSVAMVLHELLPDLPRWTIEMVGTDLSDHALGIGRRGIYRQWAFRHTSIDFQMRYFDQVETGLLIKPHIRQMVNFRHANLLHGAPLPQVDIVLCRNVLLYFSHAQAARAETIFYEALIPGGWLILGHAETIRQQRERWQTHLFPGAPVFQRPLNVMRTNPFVRYDTDRLTVPSGLGGSGTPERAPLTIEDVMQAIQTEDYASAESMVQAWISARPADASGHLLLAYVLANQGRPTDARRHLDDALRRDPLLADAHYLSALLHLEDDHADEARRSLRSALYCQRNHPLASYLLGNLYAQTGDRQHARLHWGNARQAIASLQPGSPVASVSEVTAGRLNALLDAQLEGFAPEAAGEVS
jgi:chemotaxis protein methyltransferase CheR